MKILLLINWPKNALYLLNGIQIYSFCRRGHQKASSENTVLC